MTGVAKPSSHSIGKVPGGEAKPARAYDDEDVIEVGTPVQVLDIRGATALVSE